MQQPFEPPPDEPQTRHEGSVRAEEIVAARDPSLSRSTNAEGPLREIAHAFRLNAEALHTLKQMQGDLAKQMRRGDRSELVVQSTQSLNETFRNLSAVQKELLRRIQQGQGRQRSSIVPLMLIGLLVVLLGGIYVILDALDRRGPVDPELAPAEVARRERAAWKEGREEGAAHAEREIDRLQESIEENKRRSAQLQGQLDAKLKQLAEIDQRKRSVEVERDEFASQVRKAQSEMMAKQVLEEEVGSLRIQLDAANRTAADAEHALELERRKNAYLRERAADGAMGISPDDPPWRPGQPAGVAPDDVARKPRNPATMTNEELLQEYQRRMRERRGEATEPPAGAATDDSSVPPATYPSDPGARLQPTTPIRPVEAPQGAAYGGDGPDTLPPPSIRRRGEPPPAPRASAAASNGAAEAVRSRINALLRASDGGEGTGWRVTRVAGVTADGISGVTLVRYGPGGQVAERVEAGSLRIDHVRARREVEFALRDGARYVAGQRMALPPAGSRVVVAREGQAAAWAQAGLPGVRSR